MHSHVDILLCDTLKRIGRNDVDPHVICHFSVHRGDNIHSGCLAKLSLRQNYVYSYKKKSSFDEL